MDLQRYWIGGSPLIGRYLAAAADRCVMRPNAVTLHKTNGVSFSRLLRARQTIIAYRHCTTIYQHAVATPVTQITTSNTIDNGNPMRPLTAHAHALGNLPSTRRRLASLLVLTLTRKFHCTATLGTEMEQKLACGAKLILLVKPLKRKGRKRNPDSSRPLPRWLFDPIAIMRRTCA